MQKRNSEKNVVQTTSKKPKLSKESKRFLDCMETAFGVLVTEYIKERMIGLSEDKQFMMAWKILHYLYSEELQPTGDLDIDIKISEVIELLPPLNVAIFKMISNERFPKTPKADDEPMYAN